MKVAGSGAPSTSQPVKSISATNVDILHIQRILDTNKLIECHPPRTKNMTLPFHCFCKMDLEMWLFIV